MHNYSLKHRQNIGLLIEKGMKRRKLRVMCLNISQSKYLY